MLNGIKCYNHRVQLESLLKVLKANSRVTKKKSTTKHVDTHNKVYERHFTVHNIMLIEIVNNTNVDITITHSSYYESIRSTAMAKVNVKKDDRVKGTYKRERCSKITTTIKVGYRIWNFDYVIDPKYIYDILYDMVQVYNGKSLIIDPKPADEIVEPEPEYIVTSSKSTKDVLPGIAGVYASFISQNPSSSSSNSMW